MLYKNPTRPKVIIIIRQIYCSKLVLNLLKIRGMVKGLSGAKASSRDYLVRLPVRLISLGTLVLYKSKRNKAQKHSQ